MEDYIGEIRIFGGNYAPRNWLLCQGQTLAINQYEYLFSLIGTKFGGDGKTNFQLPDLRGRCPVSPGTYFREGTKQGLEGVTLTYPELPAHTHNSTFQLTGTLRCNNNLADHESPVGNTLAKFKDNIDVYNSNQPDADMHEHTAAIDGTIAVEPTGQSYMHENRQPSLALNYIICFNGLYPERS
jgi:microcystin-dependent protein